MSTGGTAEPLVFGITSDQFDELDRLIHRLTAHGDVIASGCADELSDGNLLFVGEVILEAARAARAIFERIDAQKLENSAPAPAAAAPQARLPIFAHGMHDRILRAYSIMQLLGIAAYQDDGMDDAGGACRVVSDLLWQVNEYIADNFDSLSGRFA